MRNPQLPYTSVPFPISAANFGTPPRIIPHLPPPLVPQMPPAMLDKGQLDMPISRGTLRQRVRRLFGG